MTNLDQSEESLVIRTDFNDDQAWAAVKAATAQPVGGFQAYVNFVDDRQYDGLTLDRLLNLMPESSKQTFVFLADAKTITDPEHPVLVVDLCDERGRMFRVIPSQMWAVENNLSIANMDWEDFANHTDDNGVFRGFSE